MDKHQVKRIMLRHGLFWGWAIITPSVVMVVLDLFERHTASNIAMYSGIFIMLPFLFCNKFIAGQLESLIPSENEG